MRVQSVQVSPFSQRRYEGEIVLSPHSNTAKRTGKGENERVGQTGRATLTPPLYM